MGRYLRLYVNFIRFSVSRAMEFRFDWWARIIMDTVYYALHIGFFKIIYLHTGTIAGWREDQAMVFIAIYLMIDAIHMTVISGNMYMLGRYINSGALDYYLVRPVSSVFFLTLRDFSGPSFINFLTTIGILVWALLSFSEPFGPFEVSLLVFSILLGSLVFYSLRVLWATHAFWTESSLGTDHLFFALTDLSMKPDGVYHGLFRKALTTVIPFALVASFPARVFFGPDRFSVLAHLAIVAALFFMLMLWVWGKAVRAYGSASS